MNKNGQNAFLVIAIMAIALFCGQATEAAAQKVQVPDNTPAGMDPDLLDDNLDFLDEEAGQQDQHPPAEIADPVIPFNRAMFALNDKIILWVVEPVSKGYKKVVPTVARTGIKNFFSNLGAPWRAVNCLLQAKGTKAGTELSRFFVNTTIGVLGFGDPAQKKLPRPSPEDLGQTFAVWGIGDGFYLLMPVLGPSTLKNALGSFGDGYGNPIRYVGEWEIETGAQILHGINEASFRIGDYQTMKNAAMDPYDAMKNGYVQRRNKLNAE